TTSPGRRIWLHAVSVGEVLLLKPVLEKLQQQYPHDTLYLSVTTVTGREVAEKTYPSLNIVWFPFDFSWAVRRALNLIQPDLMILAELELWPNFIREAHRRSIPIVVINGRISEKSFRGYLRLRGLMSSLLRRIDRFAVQEALHAERLQKLGMPGERISVTGSIKYDGVNLDQRHPRILELRQGLGLGEDSLVWVVGSTQAPEEAWALDIFQKLKAQFPKLHLILVPRHQERFDEVARLMEARPFPSQRRSQLPANKPPAAVTLVDTLGELKYIWGLAHVGFVGGSFNERGGQNMIEPAAYGVAVTFGPNTWNFQHTVQALLQHQAAIMVPSKEDWAAVTERLLQDPFERAELGQRAADFVASQQGATRKTMD
ncbi:MAG TPA: 3-deoxy-D-manno-octulosonic acid transferase, partial [Gemmatales bacterium]|nr:3-deoxy-D-manno-octulosonic acid transferase [Gemmatales bacterium]